MSVAAPERRALRPVPPGAEGLGGRVPAEETLEAAILGAWRSLSAEGRCECPVCAGGMDLRSGQGSCAACGSVLG